MYKTKMAKRCSKRRRTRRGGMGQFDAKGASNFRSFGLGGGGGRKKMMRTRRRTRGGGGRG